MYTCIHTCFLHSVNWRQILLFVCCPVSTLSSFHTVQFPPNFPNIWMLNSQRGKLIVPTKPFSSHSFSREILWETSRFMGTYQTSEKGRPNILRRLNFSKHRMKHGKSNTKQRKIVKDICLTCFLAFYVANLLFKIIHFFPSTRCIKKCLQGNTHTTKI